MTIIANWKMYKTGAEAAAFVKQLKAPTKGVRAFIAPAFTAIAPAAAAAKGSSIVIGAQDIHEAEEGAFTGAVSARMVLEAGAKFVILGHSERRRLFQESDAVIQKKVSRALSSGLLPVLCVGESQQERESGRTAEVLKRQIGACLEGIKPSDIILAYEPVWAIGTGKTATPEMAEEAHLLCRGFLAQVWGAAAAQKTPILYGGSVTPETAPALLKQGNVNGALVGGASLDPQKFSQILQGAVS